MLGNDVVWLADPHNVGRHADLLLVRRVLTPRERLLVQVATDPDRMLWSLWAAKEAAFKAWSRDQRGLKFSPSLFEVVPNPTLGSATVTLGNQSLPVVWEQGPDWVHALAAENPLIVMVRVEKHQGPHESEAVRDLALLVCAELGYAPGTIEETPPLYRPGVGDPLVISLDGPYSAVAVPYLR